MMPNRRIQIANTLPLSSTSPAYIICAATIEASATEDIEVREETYTGDCTLDVTGGVTAGTAVPEFLAKLLAQTGFSVRVSGTVTFTVSVDRFMYREITPPLVQVKNRRIDCWAAALATVRNWAGNHFSLEDMWKLVPGAEGRALTDEEFARAAEDLSGPMHVARKLDLSDPRTLLGLLRNHGPLIADLGSSRDGFSHAVVVYGLVGDGTATNSQVFLLDPARVHVETSDYATFLDLYANRLDELGTTLMSGSRLTYFPQRAGKKRPPPYVVIEGHGVGTLCLSGDGNVLIPKELWFLSGGAPFTASGKQDIAIKVQMRGGAWNSPNHDVVLDFAFGPYPVTLRGRATLED